MMVDAVYLRVLLGAFIFTAAEAHAVEPPRSPLLIENVNILPMSDDGDVLRDRDVVIEGDRIIAIQAADTGKEFPTAHRIDGRGKWLIPALSDMHVHVENDRLLRLYLGGSTPADGTLAIEDIFLPYVAHGVLQIFNLSAMSESVGQQVAVRAGRIAGPRMAMAAMIDGPDPVWPVGMTRVAVTPSDGRQAVRDAAAEGYGFVKTYSHLDLPTFTAIVDEARKLNMRVVGHIPQRKRGITAQFFQPGFDLVAHAEEFALQTEEPDESAIPRYVEMMKGNGTWLVSTLTLDQRILEQMQNPTSLKTRPELIYLAPPFYPVVTEHSPYVSEASEANLARLSRIVQFNDRLVAASAAAGIPILAGTDAPVPGLVPGFALHDELEALVRAGLTPRQSLESATRMPAEWLGVAHDRGVVAEGKRADLILLDANPLEKIANTRRIAAVILGGRYLSRAALDMRMRDLRRRNMSASERATKSITEVTP